MTRTPLARLTALAVAPVAMALSFAAPAPVAAQSGEAFFTAQLAAPATEARFAAGGLVWHCEGTACRAARSTARPLRVCTALRREAGSLVGFVVNGEAFDDSEVARCNG